VNDDAAFPMPSAGMRRRMTAIDGAFPWTPAVSVPETVLFPLPGFCLAVVSPTISA
jgi:hypothetical protein